MRLFVRMCETKIQKKEYFFNGLERNKIKKGCWRKNSISWVLDQLNDRLLRFCSGQQLKREQNIKETIKNRRFLSL